MDELGHGGVVWRVQDRTLNRSLAMKIIHQNREYDVRYNIRSLEGIQVCA